MLEKLILNSPFAVLLLCFCPTQVASWMSTEMEPPVIKWAPGSLMFATGSSELSFWIPDLSKLGAYIRQKVEIL